jgi:hypothetical protein
LRQRDFENLLGGGVRQRFASSNSNASRSRLLQKITTVRHGKGYRGKGSG